MKMQYNQIPVVMICDENFAMHTCVALTSLKMNKKESTCYEVYVMAADCSEKAIKKLQEQKGKNFNVHIIQTSVKEYEIVKQVTHISIAGLLKFDICNLLPQYEKILYLDGDIIIREDLWDLYSTDIGDNYVACVVHSLGIISSEMKMNSGVMLLNATKIRDENTRDVLVKTRVELGERKSMDQETFQIVFGEKKKFVHPRYNIMMDKVEYEKKYYSIKEFNKFYGTNYKNSKEIVDTAAIIHFTGAIKPWKYKFAKGFKEWYFYYQIAFGGQENLVLKGKIQYLQEEFKKNGVRGLYWLLKDKILIFIGEYFGLYLDKSHGEWN